LVAGKVEDIAEATTRVDDSLTSLFRLSATGKGGDDVRTRNDLSGSNGSHIGASSGERRVEAAILSRVVGSVGCDTLTAVAADTVIATAVQHAGTHETELHVLITLTLLIKGCEIGFVVTVGCADDLGRCECSAILLALVAALVRVREDTVLRRIVTAFVCAV